MLLSLIQLRFLYLDLWGMLGPAWGMLGSSCNFLLLVELLSQHCSLHAYQSLLALCMGSGRNDGRACNGLQLQGLVGLMAWCCSGNLLGFSLPVFIESCPSAEGFLPGTFSDVFLSCLVFSLCTSAHVLHMHNILIPLKNIAIYVLRRLQNSCVGPLFCPHLKIPITFWSLQSDVIKMRESDDRVHGMLQCEFCASSWAHER